MTVSDLDLSFRERLTGLFREWTNLPQGSKADLLGDKSPTVRLIAGALSKANSPAATGQLTEPVSPISPAHYQTQGGAQVIDIARELDFCRGNVVKYVARAGKKDARKELEDLLKAKWYLDEAIDQVQAEQERNQYNQ